MTLPLEQTEQIKQQIIQQIENTFPEDKKESAIQRIVNLTKNEEEEVLKEVREIFINQEKLSIEREKTEKEKQIIQDILAKLREFLSEYGIESLNLTLDHIIPVRWIDQLGIEEERMFMPENYI